MAPADQYGSGAGVFCRFLLNRDWTSNQLTGTANSTSSSSNRIEYWLNPTMSFSVSFAHSVDLKPHMSCNLTANFNAKNSSDRIQDVPKNIHVNNKAKSVPFSTPCFSFPFGHQLTKNPIFAESWRMYSRLIKNQDYFYANSLSSLRYEKKEGELYQGTNTFSGSVQNTRDILDFILVQGIHCKNYLNGYFMQDDTTYYAYSHDSAHLFPSTPGRLQKRNPDYTTVPFLMLYERSSFNNTPMPKPQWAAFLNTNWYYFDLFSCINLSSPENYYMPASPILLSSGNRFFMIGNAEKIGKENIRGIFKSQEIHPGAHHYGFITAFQLGCPPLKLIYTLQISFVLEIL